MKKIIVSLIVAVTMLSLISLVGCAKLDMEVVPLPTKETLSKDLTNGGYKLVFEDEFEGEEINDKVWSVGYGSKSRRGGYYTDDAVFVKDGNLTIRTNYRKDGEHGSGWYTGWVESASPNGGHGADRPEGYTGFSTKYGYYEVRCKVPPAKGIWSAFWMMPDSGKGAKGMGAEDDITTGRDGVEVDIMESPYYQIDGNKSTNVHVIHGNGYGENAMHDRSPAYNIGDMYGEFHRYGVMWTAEEYIFYVDGVETYRTKVVSDGTEYGVSQVEEYMLLTVEIAGCEKDGKIFPGKEFGKGGKLVKHWAGNPGANNKSRNYDFVIDYVRVYQQVA